MQLNTFTTAGPRVSEVIQWELDRNVNREEVTILAGSGSDRVLTTNMVLGIGAVTSTAVDESADAGNTGNGVVGAATLGPLAQNGRYIAECVEAAANAGRFIVTAPDGSRVVANDGADLVVAVAFASDHINLTVADGAADFIVGDRVYIDTAGVVRKLVQHVAAATDGRQIPAGILMRDKTAPDGTDATGIAMTRGPAIIVGENLVHDAAANAAQKASVLATFDAMGIKSARGVGFEAVGP